MSDEDFLQRFYADYLQALRREPRIPFSQIVPRLEGNLTPAFVATIRHAQEQLDADPILDAQDYSDDWQRQLAVSFDAAGMDGARYLVCFGAPGGMRHALVATVIRQYGRPLLGGVRMADPARCHP